MKNVIKMCVNQRTTNRLLLTVRQFVTSQAKRSQTVLRHRTGDKTVEAITRTLLSSGM
jgi:hypothetical protein